MFALSHFSQPLRSSPQWITLKDALPTAITNCIFSQIGQVPHSAQPEVRAEWDRHKWGRWNMAWTCHWQCQFQWTEVTVWQCPKCLQLLSMKPSVMDRQLPAVASKEFWEKMWQSAWPSENTSQLSCQFASQHVPLSCCPPPPIPHTLQVHIQSYLGEDAPVLGVGAWWGYTWRPPSLGALSGIHPFWCCKEPCSSIYEWQLNLFLWLGTEIITFLQSKSRECRLLSVLLLVRVLYGI